MKVRQIQSSCSVQVLIWWRVYVMTSWYSEPWQPDILLALLQTAPFLQLMRP